MGLPGRVLVFPVQGARLVLRAGGEGSARASTTLAKLHWSARPRRVYGDAGTFARISEMADLLQGSARQQ